MAYSLNLERAAMVLVESMYYGDTATAKRWKLSTRTIDNYRRRLNTDLVFAELFQKYQKSFEGDWAKELPLAARAIIRRITELAQSIDVNNSEDMQAMAEALKVIAEIGLTKDVIDAQLGRYNREDNQEIDEITSSSTLLAD